MQSKIITIEKKTFSSKMTFENFEDDEISLFDNIQIIR